MPANIVIKLTRAEYSLDLADDTGAYVIAQGFAPPPVAIQPIIAPGIVGDQVGRYVKAGERYNPREFAFGLHVLGSSEADVRRHISVLDEFIRSGSETDPVYLEVRGNADVPVEPRWGQYGANLRYEVISGSVMVPPEYTIGALRTQIIPQVTVSLIIGPIALGRGQRMASATRGVRIDDDATADGGARGVIVSPGQTNLHTNPVFGHTTWNTGWSVTSCHARQNRNRDYLLFGASSARISGTAASGRFTQSLNLTGGTTHILSYFVKRPDGGVVTSADCQVWYDGSARSTTFVALENGFYRIFASVSGSGAPAEAGVNVKNKFTVYLDGAMAVAFGGLTSFGYGDMIGWSWASTHHNSASTALAGRLRVPIQDFIDDTSFTIRVVLKMNAASSVYSADSFILEDSNDLIAFHWDEPGNGWRFTDGVTPITGSGDSFSFGDRLVFHIVAGPTGMTIYKNGVSYASTGTGYTAPAASATYMYIGSDDDGANQMFVTFMDLATFDANFSSAQVLADYNNIVQVINDDRQASPLPFLWSDDGDDIVDNGLDTSLENYVVCAGIPGSLPAQTEIFGALSSNWSNVFSVWFSLITLDHFVLPTTVLYADESGTVQAGNVGGQYRQTSVGTAVEGVLVGDLVISSQDREKFLELLGKEYYLMARIYDAGSTLQIASRLLVGGSSIGLETEFKAISTTTGERQYVTQPLVIFNQTDFFLGAKFNKLGTQFPTTDAQFILLARRTSGTANIRVDYIAVLPRPACRLQGNFAAANFIYRGTSGIITDSNLIFQKQLSHTGDAIELVPGKYNTLMMYLGDESGNSTVSWTLTYNNIYVTPRYALL